MKKLLRFKYRPFHQFPFCCVPTTLQWIFYRRGFDILDPMTIGAELGLRIPENLPSILMKILSKKESKNNAKRSRFQKFWYANF